MVTGAHVRNSGVLWVKYPNNPKLYQVEHHLIIDIVGAVDAHLQKVRKGKTPIPPDPRGKMVAKHTRHPMGVQIFSRAHTNLRKKWSVSFHQYILGPILTILGLTCVSRQGKRSGVLDGLMGRLVVS